MQVMPKSSEIEESKHSQNEEDTPVGCVLHLVCFCGIFSFPAFYLRIILLRKSEVEMCVFM